MTLSIKAERNRKLGESVAANLRARYFDASYYDTQEEAVAAAIAMIPEGSSVTFGGSMTVLDSGLVSALKAGNYQVYDRADAPAESRADFTREHFFSDWFLSSTNALSEEGVLYNMDGSGNRVASYIFGPKTVLLLVGLNKVVKNHEAAIARVRGTAAPINAQRFDVGTPCKKTGRCADCRFPDSICCTMTVMRLCRPHGRIKVLLFGEEAGF